MTIEIAMEILKNFSAMGASPGGQAALANFFTDHGITPESVAAAVKLAPVAPPPTE